MVGPIRHLHFDQHIAGHEPLLGLHLLAAADLDHVLGRDHDLGDLVLDVVLARGVLDRLGDLLRSSESTLTEYQRIAIVVQYLNRRTAAPARGRVVLRAPQRPTKTGAQPNRRTPLIRPETGRLHQAARVQEAKRRIV